MDEWHGVSCCPYTHPHAKVNQTSSSIDCCQHKWDGDRCADDGVFRWDQTLRPRGIFPNGCSSGNVTGTEDDRALCVVVALRLPSNNLEGQLLDTHLGLERLSVLDLSGNKLHGELPIDALADLTGGVGSLTTLELSNNDPGFAWREGAYDRLFDNCRARALQCTDVPPDSCELFHAPDSGYYKPSAEEPNICTKCTNWTVTFTIAIVGLVVALLLVVGYGVVLVCVKGTVVFKWETTVVILFMHMQTVSIVSALRLAWPPSVERTFELFNLGAFQVSGLRPECLVGDDSEVSLYYVVSISKISAVLGLHVLILGLRGFAKAMQARSARFSRSGSLEEKRVRLYSRVTDVAFLIGSFIFVLSYVASFNASLGVLRKHWSQRQAAREDTLLVALAVSMLVIDVLLIVEQFLSVHALRLLRGDAKRGATPCLDALATSGLAPQDEGRLAARLYFLCRRFRPTKLRWQFIVAGRQTLLSLVSFVGSIYSEREEYAKSTSKGKMVVWAQAVSAVVVLTLATALHVRYKPFRYHFQNRLETGLFVSDVVLILLCLVYTVMPIKQKSIEVIMCSLLIGAITTGMAYCWREARREGLTQIGDKAVAALEKMANDIADRTMSFVNTTSFVFNKRGSLTTAEQNLSSCTVAGQQHVQQSQARCSTRRSAKGEALRFDEMTSVTPLRSPTSTRRGSTVEVLGVVNEHAARGSLASPECRTVTSEVHLVRPYDSAETSRQSTGPSTSQPKGSGSVAGMSARKMSLRERPFPAVGRNSVGGVESSGRRSSFCKSQRTSTSTPQFLLKSRRPAVSGEGQPSAQDLDRTRLSEGSMGRADFAVLSKEQRIYRRKTALRYGDSSNDLLSPKERPGRMRSRNTSSVLNSQDSMPTLGSPSFSSSCSLPGASPKVRSSQDPDARPIGKDEASSDTSRELASISDTEDALGR